MTSNTKFHDDEQAHLTEQSSGAHIDSVILGYRLRHFRTEASMTLEELATKLGATASHLSMIENGKREPKVSLLSEAAELLGIEVADLLVPEAPTARAALEISVEKAQGTRHWQAMGLPNIRVSSRIPTPVLEIIDGLTRELRRQHAEQAATPEEARRANVAMRKDQRERNNYYAELEAQARQLLTAVGHEEAESEAAAGQRQLRCRADRLHARQRCRLRQHPRRPGAQGGHPRHGLRIVVHLAHEGNRRRRPPHRHRGPDPVPPRRLVRRRADRPRVGDPLPPARPVGTRLPRDDRPLPGLLDLHPGQERA